MAWVYSGCSTQSVPSWSKVAMRSSGATKFLLYWSVVTRTKSRAACLAGPAFHEGRTPARSPLPRSRRAARAPTEAQPRLPAAHDGLDRYYLKSAFTPPVWIRPVAPRHLLVIVLPLSDRPLDPLHADYRSPDTEKHPPGSLQYTPCISVPLSPTALPSIRVRSGAPYEKRTRSDQDAGEPGLSQAGTRGPTYRLHIAFLHC